VSRIKCSLISFLSKPQRSRETNRIHKCTVSTNNGTKTGLYRIIPNGPDKGPDLLPAPVLPQSNHFQSNKIYSSRLHRGARSHNPPIVVLQKHEEHEGRIQARDLLHVHLLSPFCTMTDSYPSTQSIRESGWCQ
jgi:hypothetical protein